MSNVSSNIIFEELNRSISSIWDNAQRPPEILSGGQLRRADVSSTRIYRAVQKHPLQDTVNTYIDEVKTLPCRMGWKETIIDWFDIFGPAALTMLSFTEAIIQPVPPDLLYIPMLLDALGNGPLMLWLWIVVTLSSVAGALVGYFLGKKYGVQLISYFGYERHIQTLENLSEKYGGLGIFIAACSPLPYKVFGWVAGMASMNKKVFVVAGLLGRGFRFGLEAILIWYYGDKVLDAIMWFLNNELLLGAAIIVLCGVVGFMIFRTNSSKASSGNGTDGHV